MLLGIRTLLVIILRSFINETPGVSQLRAVVSLPRLTLTPVLVPFLCLRISTGILSSGALAAWHLRSVSLE